MADWVWKNLERDHERGMRGGYDVDEGNGRMERLEIRMEGRREGFW